MTSVRMPPQATGEEGCEQVRSLLEVDHEAVVVVEYVDRMLGLAGAREVDSGLPVALAAEATRGFNFLNVGQRLMAQITKLQHATAVEAIPAS